MLPEITFHVAGVRGVCLGTCPAGARKECLLMLVNTYPADWLKVFIIFVFHVFSEHLLYKDVEIFNQE